MAPPAQALSISAPSLASSALKTLNNVGIVLADQTATTSNNPSTTPPQPASSVAADTMTMKNGKWTAVLRRSANPIPITSANGSPDILGIKPGMSVNAVKSAIASNYLGQPVSSSAEASYEYKSITMWSQPYTAELFGEKGPNDYIRVYFGTQTTGNTVVGMSRKLKFNNVLAAPTMKQIASALEEKYGPPTTPAGNLNRVPWFEMNWVFGKNGLLHKPCPQIECPCISNIANISNDGGISFIGGIHMLDYGEGYLPANATGSWIRTYGSLAAVTPISIGEYACVYAFVAAANQDQSRAGQLTVVISDTADQFLTIRETINQLHATAVAAYKEVATPEKPPNL